MELQPTHYWAGHRTFTPDSRFLLGPDPRLPGVNWAAGLGGHGVTAATAVGRRVAEAIVDGTPIEELHALRSAVCCSHVATILRQQTLWDVLLSSIRPRRLRWHTAAEST